MEENSYCKDLAKKEAEDCINVDQLCGIKSSDGDSDDDEEAEQGGDTINMDVDETGLEQPSDDQVEEWETRLKEIASDMIMSEGYDHLGRDLENLVGKVKTAQRRIASAASAKRKERAIQSKMDSFFKGKNKGKNKPQKQAGEKIDI